MFDHSEYISLLKDLEIFFQYATEENLVTSNLKPDELRANIDLKIGNSVSDEDLRSLIQQYLKYSVKTSHPRYFNQLWGGFQKAGFMGDVISSAANTSMYTHEVAPVATLIEKELVQKMGKIAGFENPEGQFTTGGSNGNLMAVVMARHQACERGKQEGLFGQQKMVIFTSAESHYSILKAANITGIGADQVWKVEVDDEGKMDMGNLRRLIQKAREEGSMPMMMVGTAGTTVRGAYDPLEEMADIAREEGLWFHVDGAWGGSALLSSKHRYLLKGVERADSFVWDAHKMMGMSLMCSVLLVREKGKMMSTFSADHSKYLFRDEEASDDLGPSSMHCGRKNDALKLWLAWKSLGDEGWERIIDYFFELAEYAEQIIHEFDQLELVVPRSYTNVCFRFIPKGKDGKDGQDFDAFTSKLRQELLASGHSMVNQAMVEGKEVIRLVICNHSTKKKHVEQFFEEVVRVGEGLNCRYM